MVIGLINPNMVYPLTKMCITNLDKNNEKIYVLYNPESYMQSREVKYGEANSLEIDAPSLQFVQGSSETIQMELFFDTFSAGAEAGGMSDKLKLAANSLKPSPLKTDVRDYTSKIYELTKINSSTHAPPRLKIEWSSLQFTGYLVSCSQKFTKFNESGKPVRATLTCEFKQFVEIVDSAKLSPKESPDTTKYRTVETGSSLWSLSSGEYGMCDMWREIAKANNIDNPRLLNSGDLIKLPAIK